MQQKQRVLKRWYLFSSLHTNASGPVVALLSQGFCTCCSLCLELHPLWLVSICSCFNSRATSSTRSLFPVSYLVAFIWICNDIFLCEIVLIKFCLQHKMVNSRRTSSSSFLLAMESPTLSRVLGA